MRKEEGMGLRTLLGRNAASADGIVFWVTTTLCLAVWLLVPF